MAVPGEFAGPGGARGASRRLLLTPLTKTPLHRPTQAVATGLGDAVASGHRVLPGKGSIWNPHVSGCLPVNVSVAGVAPVVELERWRRVSDLRKKFVKAVRENVVGLPILAFERWLLRSKLAEQNGPSSQAVGDCDPVLPSEVYAEPGLIRDLERASVPADAAAAIALEMAELSCANTRKVASLSSAVAKGEVAAGVVEVTVHKHSFDVQLQETTKDQGKPVFFKLNPTHWQKLCSLYCRTCMREQKEDVAGGSNIEQTPLYQTCVDPKAATKDAIRFRQHVYCLLARYHAIQGPGFQAAVVEHGFAVLREHMGVTLECFASPLNCHFGQYCSAFPDTDVAFGSIGSFFDFAPQKGSFQVNPPFIDSLMLRAVERIIELLDRAKERGDALSFVLIIPGWQEDVSWQRCQNSSYLRAHWLIAKADHGFCDGAQHQRRDRYRASPFDTSVFVLQTDSGAKQWPATPAIEQAFRHSMAQGVPTPSMVARRLKDGRGIADEDGAGGVYRGKAKQKRKQRQRATGGAPTSSEHASKDNAQPRAKSKGRKLKKPKQA